MFALIIRFASIFVMMLLVGCAGSFEVPNLTMPEMQPMTTSGSEQPRTTRRPSNGPIRVVNSPELERGNQIPVVPMMAFGMWGGAMPPQCQFNAGNPLCAQFQAQQQNVAVRGNTAVVVQNSPPQGGQPAQGNAPAMSGGDLNDTDRTWIREHCSPSTIERQPTDIQVRCNFLLDRAQSSAIRRVQRQ